MICAAAIGLGIPAGKGVAGFNQISFVEYRHGIVLFIDCTISRNASTRVAIAIIGYGVGGGGY